MTDLNKRIAELSPEKRALLLRRLQQGGTPERPAAIPHRADPGDYPLSFAQQRMWFLSQLEPDSPLYTIAAALRITGALDGEALRRSLCAVAGRHEPLRASFATVKGRPVQRVAPEADLPLPLTDLRGLPAEERLSTALRLATEEVQRPFALHTGPLWRAALIRLADDDHILTLALHHIAADGWSVGLLIHEVALCYEALCAGRAPELPPLPIHYADYAAWQREWLYADDRSGNSPFARQLAWWREHLAGPRGHPPALELPTDRPRPKAQTYHGAHLTVPLDGEALAALRRLAREEDATPFMALLAVFQTLLHRYTDQDDFCVGTPVAGRSRPELEALIGCFVNTLALRADLADELTFRALLRRVREAALGAYSHQELPFELLIDELHPERDLSRTPIFQAMFVLQDEPIEGLRLAGIAIAPLEIESGTAKFDLMLMITEAADGARATFEYNTDLFDGETIRRMAGHFGLLLAGAATDPDTPVSRLPLLTAAEWAQLRAWNQTARPYDLSRPLHAWVEAQVAQTPTAPALLADGVPLSYAALNARANQLAHLLRARGVGPDTLVAVALDRSSELVISLLAILKAGGAYLPLDPAAPPARWRFMLDDAQPVALLTARGRWTPETGAGATAPPPLPAGPWPVVDLTADSATLARQPTADPAPLAGPSHLAYCLYTSGSTGQPKGALLEHRAIVNRLLWMQETYRLTPADRVLQKTPASFDVSVWEFFWPLMTGATLVVAPPGAHQDPAALAALIQQAQVTTLHFVPSMLAVFLDDPRVARCTSLRQVFCSGEALPADLAQRCQARLPQAALHNLYGPTEAAVDVSAWPCSGAEAAGGGVPIGRPVANTQLWVRDRHGQVQPVGVPGELVIGGVQVGRGYLNRPALTAERFVAGDGLLAGARLYRTGDRCRWRADGALEFLGRLDGQVKLRGVRIELGEVEATLRAHPEVAAAAALAREDRPGAPRLVAYVVPAAGAGALSRAALLGWLQARLPAVMVPTALVVLEALPLLPNGKLDRRALPPPDDRPADAPALVAPRTALERYLADVWREVLGVAQVGVYDNFFELGGDSLQAAVLVNRIQEDLGVTAHLRSLFYAPTVAESALYFQEYFPEVVAARFGEAATGRLKEKLAEELAPGAPAAIDEAAIARFRDLVPPLAPRPQPVAGKNPTAVFVLAPPRSGSTLLRVMLAGHPQLFAPPELELLNFNDLAERRATFSGVYEPVLEGTIRALMAARGLDADAATALMERLERERCSTYDFYALLQASIGQRMLVDKTPSYALDPAVLRRAEAEFDRPRYIHLVRQPYATIYSFVEARLHEWFIRRPHDFSVRELAELVWIACHRNILDFRGEIPPERYHMVRYEDLVRRPHETMEALCAFLGLPFDPGTLRPYEGERMTDGVRPTSQMVGDLKFYMRREIDPRPAERWKRLHAGDFLSEAGWTLAEQLGYERVRAAGDTPAPRRPLRPIPRDQPLPLSFAQQRLWVLDQLEPGSALYNIPVALRLRGVLDRGALERSLAEVVRRHETLRTSFAAADGQPVQVIAPPAPVALPLIDLTHLASDARDVEASRLAAAEARTPFDLERGPLLRAQLIRLGEHEHIFLLTLHHIVADGWSTGVLVREIGALYQDLREGRPPALPELPVQYADYAAWQREELAGGALERQLAWWKERLAGAPELLELPTDRPRPAVQRFAGARLPFTLAAETVAALREFCRREGVTLFMALTAAFQTLLARYSDQGDICVGTPVAGRDRAEIEPLIGCFVNTLVLRTDLSDEPTFRALVRRVQQVTAEAFAHQDAPFELVVDALQPERSLSHAPLFQALITLNKGHLQTLQLPGLTLEPLHTDSQTAKFDLTLALVERTDGIAGALEYATDLFDQATMERALTHLQRLLAAGLAAPETPVSRLPLLDEAERAALTDGRNQIVNFPVTETLATAFAAQVARTPDAIAVSCQGQHLTYAALNARANQLAHLLRAHGVGPEMIVALQLERSPDLVVAILAVLKAGGAYLPIEPATPPERLRFVLEDAGPAVVLTDDGRRTTDGGAGADSRTTLPAGPWAVIDLAADGPAIARQPATDPPPLATPAHLAYCIYTSGSTGQPKGCLVTHANVMRLFAATDAWFGFDPHDVWTLFHSAAFDFSVWELWGALLYGGRLVVVPWAVSRDPEAFYRLLVEEQVTVLNQTPSAFHQLSAAEARLGVAPDLALRYVIFGGEALEFASLRPWFDRHSDARPRLVNMYGITETTVHVTYRPLTAADAAAGGSRIGQRIPDLTLYVLDRHRQPVPPGVPGELYVGGAGVARGYLNRPDLTAERFLEAGGVRHEAGDARHAPSVQPPAAGLQPPAARLYRTGDRVRWRADGDLEYLGRIDQQVKIRGFRIELGEIAAALTAHPNVREAVVVVREDRPGDRRLVAYVVPVARSQGSGDRVQDADGQTGGPSEASSQEPGGEGAGDPERGRGGDPERIGDGRSAPTSQRSTLHAELPTWLRERLPDYMVPAAIVALDALPLTANGKLDRNALPQPAIEATDGPGDAPQTEAERTLAAIWTQVLGVTNVARGANFFELGGDSILAIQVITRARQAGLHLAPRDLFQHPTLSALAAAATPTRRIEAPQGLVTGPAPLTPIQRWFLEKPLPRPQHWNQALLLETDTPLDHAALAAAVQALLVHHDALRTRLSTGPDGPVAVLAGEEATDPGPVLAHYDLSALPPEAQPETITAACATLQASLDLARGPLLRVAAFDLGADRPGRLLIAIHHLAVDGVSWRILLEDLHAAYAQARAGDPPRLPPKTTPISAWAARLAALAAADTTRAELPFWLAAAAPAAPLPLDDPAGADSEADNASVRVALAPDETDALLRIVPAAYGTTIDDALLAALALALRDWTGAGEVVVMLEGHGRADLFDDLDLSRTVGWFTSLYPVRLVPPPGDDPGAALRAVKEQLRAIPRRGIGYGLLRELGAQADRAALAALPQPAIAFNYLGQTDQALPANAPFRPAAESAGPERDPRGPRSYALEINGSIAGGQLRLAWNYSAARLRQTTVEHLAAGYLRALRAIIAHCRQPGAGGYTPSDFPEAGLSQADLDALLSEIGEATGE